MKARVVLFIVKLKNTSTYLRHKTSIYFQSLNGVYINGVKLAVLNEHTLKDQDVIQLGVPKEPGAMPEFQWKFYQQLRVKKIAKGKNSQHQHDSCEISSQNSVLGEQSNRKRRAGADENKQHR